MIEGLSAQVEDLIRQQIADWPLLGNGVSGLASSRTRRLSASGAAVLLRHLPHRVASTTAPVDRESIRKRPCFLCAGNLFPEQRGVAFDSELTLYCNPYPVVEKHLTVIHREHRAQRVDGQIPVLLDLAASLPGFFVLYNGPECGASAPDHLHLQAGSREGLPVLGEAMACRGPGFERHGARALLFRGRDPQALVQSTEKALAVLSKVTGRSPEPWVNIAVFFEEESSWTVLVFPRQKHRPEGFQTGELLVSPATIDMCGILVTPSAKNFEELTGERVASIYGEVSLPESQYRDVVSLLEAS